MNQILMKIFSWYNFQLIKIKVNIPKILLRVTIK